jgi:predicted esterase
MQNFETKQKTDSPINLESLAIEQTVDFAVLSPNFAIDEKTNLLVVLHGYGQSCTRFIRVFEPLQRKNILVVAPQAPHQFYVKMNPKIVGFTWLTQYKRDRSIDEFVNYMQRLLGRIIEMHSCHRGRVFFLGFSQGVSMAYRAAISGQLSVAGVIACGADLPPDVSEKLPYVERFPVFLGHGVEDTVVPLEKARQAEATLRANDFQVETFFFPGGHEIPVEVVEKIADWVNVI